MSRFSKRFAWGAIAVLFALGVVYTLNHFIPTPVVETSTPVIQVKSPLPEATQTPTPSATATLELPSATPSLAPPSATLEPVVCLDESAMPLALPARTVPLEVRFISDGNIFVWQEGDAEARQITDTGDARSFSFSPNGQIIVFQRDITEWQNELWAVGRDGMNLHLVLPFEHMNQLSEATPIPELQSFYSYWFHYSGWNMDSDVINVQVERNYPVPGGCCNFIGNFEIDLANIRVKKLREGGDASQVTKIISPDGRFVAMIGNTSLSLMDVDSGNLREDIFDYPYVPSTEGNRRVGPIILWEHDSQALLAVTYTRESMFAHEELFITWRIPIDGSPVEQLNTFEGNPFSIVISPDQQYISYFKTIELNSGEKELHLARFDGTQDKVYIRDTVSDYRFYFLWWAPDSYHFAFGSYSRREARYGSICAGNRPLLNETQQVEKLGWVDNTHFLFVHPLRFLGPKELRLGEVGGSSLLIGPFNGDYAMYEFDQDPDALGWWLYTP